MIVGQGNYVDDIGAELLQDIVRDDVYGVRGLNPDRVGFVLDIGANVGFFAVMCRMLFPRAKIVAVEPDPDAFAMLALNTAELDIVLDQRALGDGRRMYTEVIDAADHTLNRTRSEPNGNGTAVPTSTLTSLLEAHAIEPERCVFKFDCEGGERYLLDSAATTILSRAFHIGIEFHQDSTMIGFPRWKRWLHSFAQAHHHVDDAELVDTPEPWRMARVFTVT